MGSFTSAKLGRLPTGAFLAFLACALSAPARVEAGCSLHATHAAGQEGLAHFLDPAILGEPDAVASESLPTRSPGRPRPCSGPTCSENQGPPASPSVAETRYVEPGAVLVERLSLPGPSSSLLHVPSSLARAFHRGAGVFHPPRQDEPRSIV